MADPLAPGFHGKVPARGDFVSRRLPPGFAATWDRWLGTLVEGSREALGEAWLEAWLEAPIWHFALGRSVAGPAAVRGVVIPSVDRVGRYFPFSILGACHESGLAPDAWAERVEALALGALEDGFDPDALDRALAALGPPVDPADEPAADETLWRSSGAGDTVSLRFAGLPPASAAGLLVTGRAA
jgi:type VI secretion system protein ImpM